MHLTRNLLIVGVVILLTIGIIATIALTRQNQNIKSRAGADTVTLALSPTSGTLNINDPIDITVSMNAGTFNITSVDIPINYNKNVLNLTSVTPLNNFTNQLSGSPDNSTGTFRYKALDISSNSHTGVFNLVKLTFKAVGAGNGSAVTFGSDSEITAANQSSSLGTANNITGSYVVNQVTTSNPLVSLGVNTPTGGTGSGGSFRPGDTLNVSWTAYISNQPTPPTAPIQTAVGITTDGDGLTPPISCDLTGSNLVSTTLSNGTWQGSFSGQIPTTGQCATLNGSYHVFVWLKKDLYNYYNILIQPHGYSPVVSITQTVPASVTLNSGSCTIQHTWWAVGSNNLNLTVPVVKGTTVNLNAALTGDCTSGQRVIFDIWKANGSLGPYRITSVMGPNNNGISVTANNTALGQWVADIPLTQIGGGQVTNGPVEFYFTAYIVTQNSNNAIKSDTPNLQVIESVPNKVRVMNVGITDPNMTDAQKQTRCSNAFLESGGSSSGSQTGLSQVFNYIPGAPINWDITQNATGFGLKLICARFGFEDSNVIDWRSYSPLVTNTVNYQQPTSSSSQAVATVSVLKPKGGEQFKVGDSITINWSADFQNQATKPSLAIPTTVQLTQDDGNSRRAVCSIVNTNTNYGGTWSGNYTWQIPETCNLTGQPVALSGQYRVRVQLNNQFQNGAVYIYPFGESSQQFTIQPSASPSVTPTGGSNNPKCVQTNGHVGSNGQATLFNPGGKSDFDTWLQEFLGKTTEKLADFNCDGTIDLFNSTHKSDFDIWLTNYLGK